MSGFFEEVRRRKVYRVAVAYVIAAGFIIQFASAVFPAWELPVWSLRLAIAFLLIGFPIALILAWAYDVTPQGIQATPKAPAGVHRRRNFVFLIAAGVTLSAVAGWFLLPRTSSRTIDKSVAVLPFASLSDDKENAYFTEGIQEDILTNLARIGDLKVISRTSTVSYRDNRTRSAREIGKALGVASLLEGSVRRSGNRVRVSVQLINAEDDGHIWAEDYDRDLNDIFAIQSDLAQKIAYTLQAKLSVTEKSRLQTRPTESPQAYLLFMEAQRLASGPDHWSEDARKAEQLYEEAIKLDPKFAAAYAGVSRVASWAYHGFDPTPARREKARLNAEEALRLQPDLAEGHIALGFYYYYGVRDYGRALGEFEIARRGLPNEADAWLAIGAIQRRQARWAESNASLERAAALDPRNPSVLYNLAFSYMAQRDFEKAERAFDRAGAAAPQSFTAQAVKGLLSIIWKGDLTEAERAMDSFPRTTDTEGLVTGTRVWLLTLGRRFPEALEVAQQFPGEVLQSYEGSVPKAFLVGLTYHFMGDHEKAAPALEVSLAVAERLVRETPDDALRHASLGQILAMLDRKESAIAEGKRAAELLPESEDAYDGPKISAILAGIYATVGENDEAFRLIEHLLQVPNGLTVPVLKLDPSWDPVRKDPRFQALLDKYSAKR